MPKITFTVSNKGAAWIKAQAKALGVDESGIAVRMLVLWAERNGVELSVGTAPPKPVYVAKSGVASVKSAVWQPGWTDENGRMPTIEQQGAGDGASVDVDALVNSTLSEAESAGALEQPLATEAEEPPASTTTPLVRRKGVHGGVGNLVALR